MRKIVAVLLLVAAGVAVPVSVLVVRALESAAIEEENRHRSIADRAFDAMETSLSRFLAAEESRPFGEYRFYEEISPTEPERRRRSPLSVRPSRPFVTGYFQIEPDGQLRTPERPVDLALAQRLGDYAPSGEVEQLESKLRQAWMDAQIRPPRMAVEARQLVEALRPGVELTRADTAGGAAKRDVGAIAERMLGRAAPQSGADPDAAVDDESEAPFGAVDLASMSKKNEQQIAEPYDLAEREAEGARADDYSSYEVLKSFNVASARRAQRKQQIRVERAPAVEPAGQRARSKDLAAPSAAVAPAPVRPSGATGLAGALADSAPAEALQERRALRTEPATVRVALDPMVGRSAGDGALLLYRTVVAGEQGYRQGLLVDWRTLGRWLEEEVIGPTALASASRVAFFGADDPPESARPGGAAYVYRHRFAEPFDAFGVELGLDPLPGGDGTGTIYALAILLAIVGAGGLFAVYRMVSVVVEFAERRSRFVAAVSHELKTPLTSIRLYGEMLRDGIVTREEKREEYYRTIADESERLSRLIDNVLDFSRLEKGEREVRAQAGPLRPTVAEALDKLRPHAESLGFSLVPQLDDDLPDVRFDRDVVTQVVFNLVDNALKYARAAERKEIEVGCRALPGGQVVLSVRDYGPGVPKGDLARIFEAFFRSEDELTHAPHTVKGTGIGLALVKELVEAMGGTIEARDAAGGGLCVTVELPALAASGLNPAPARSAPSD